MSEIFKNLNIILASKSPRRKQLLNQADIKTETVEPAEVEEIIPSNVKTRNAAAYLSEIKTKRQAPLSFIEKYEETIADLNRRGWVLHRGGTMSLYTRNVSPVFHEKMSVCFMG